MGCIGLGFRLPTRLLPAFTDPEQVQTLQPGSSEEDPGSLPTRTTAVGTTIPQETSFNNSLGMC